MNGKVTKPHTKKIRTMALSVFLAVIVWFMVMSLTNPTITTTVSNLSVRFVGEQTLRDKNLAIIGRADIPALSVVVRGNRSDLMNFMDNIYVQVDVSGISSTGEYNLSGTISVPTTRITVEKENYSDIPITVEPLISKDIEVTVRQTGVPRNKLVSSVVDNPIVTVTGAESEISRVAGAVATVDVSRIRDENRDRVSYVLTDESGALISGNETLESARAEVEVTNIVYDAKTLPVEVVLSPELERIYTLDTAGTAVSPSSVTVGVREGGNIESVKAVVDRPAEEEAQEYLLQSADGMYIPQGSETVSIKPSLSSKDPAQHEEDIDDGR